MLKGADMAALDNRPSFAVGDAGIAALLPQRASRMGEWQMKAMAATTATVRAAVAAIRTMLKRCLESLTSSCTGASAKLLKTVSNS